MPADKNTAFPRRSIVTVTGPIAPEELGFCRCHDHVFIANGQSARINPDLLVDDVEKSTAELALYKNAGGAGIVDAQPPGCGRMVRELHAAAMATGVHIIASTGFHKLEFYRRQHWIRTIDVARLAELLYEEICTGMYACTDTTLPCDTTSFRAGIIKTACGSEGIVNRYRDLYTAAASVAVAASAPLMCHVESGADPLAMVMFLSNLGVMPRRIILCHIDRHIDDVALQSELAQTGAYLECDAIGRTKYHSDEAEAAFIMQMIDRGFQKQILLGQDATRARMKSYGAPYGLDYIAREFVPLLQRNGASQEIVDDLTIRNPARALAVGNDHAEL